MGYLKFVANLMFAGVNVMNQLLQKLMEVAKRMFEPLLIKLPPAVEQTKEPNARKSIKRSLFLVVLSIKKKKTQKQLFIFGDGGLGVICTDFKFTTNQTICGVSLQ